MGGQAGRQACRVVGKASRQTGKQAGGRAGRRAGRRAGGQAGRHAGWWELGPRGADRQAGRQTGRQAGRQEGCKARSTCAHEIYLIYLLACGGDHPGGVRHRQSRVHHQIEGHAGILGHQPRLSPMDAEVSRTFAAWFARQQPAHAGCPRCQLGFPEVSRSHISMGCGRESVHLSKVVGPSVSMPHNP